MKLKTAHIFLAAASLATLTVLAGCGTNSANELSSPGYNVNDLVNVPSVVSLAINPQSASAHVGQRIQLEANATLSDGQQIDIAQFVNWTSSDPSLASVSATGLVSAKLPGTVTITATRGSATSSIQFTVNPFITRVFTSNKTSNSIQVFDLNATGTSNPVHAISGTNTGLNAPGQMVVVGQELFVANTGAGEVDVFYLQAEGNVAPLRKIKATEIAAPTGIAINTTSNELFVLSGTNIAVFNTNDSGDAVTPKRVITGGLVATDNAQIALTPGDSSFPNAILVPNTLDVRAFAQSASGDVAPTKILTGPIVGPGTVTLLKKATAVALNTGLDNIYVSDPGSTSPVVHRWQVTADGVDVPLASIPGFGAPQGLLPVLATAGLWVVDSSNNNVSLLNADGTLNRAFTSGALSSPNGIVITGSF
ncbi:MAG: Ig-like domain-containing protein [Candidatus Eremiobacteraeota bacterium]|nr:Ig-like domain-containing protein [Candidatus Eremiobacteraeota bacterium]